MSLNGSQSPTAKGAGVMGARDGWGEVDGAGDVVGARVPDATDGQFVQSA